MIVGATKETYPGEHRVALTPNVLSRLTKAGHEVLIEAGAGQEAGFPDEEYSKHGAKVIPKRADVFAQADIICQVRALGANPEAGRGDLTLIRKDQVIVAMSEPLSDAGPNQLLADTCAIVFAMELMPRITRAQSMDVLSSQATIAGYKAVLLAANRLPRMFPMLMTAAGTVSPAHVLIIGAGVAGLQAISAARRLGGVVTAYDIRPAVREEIESLGGKFLDIGVEAADAQDKGGYAKAMNEEFYRKQREAMTKAVAESDVIITTAAVPGKKAPILITEDQVAGMHTGSVIVDLAAERGGNCDLTRPGETVEVDGVTILGPTNLPATVPYHASQMYARNLVTFLGSLTKDGALNLDLSDEVIDGTLLTRDGEIVHRRVREILGLEPLTVEDTAPAESGPVGSNS